MVDCGDLEIFGLEWRGDLREAGSWEVVVWPNCSHVYSHP